MVFVLERGVCMVYLETWKSFWSKYMYMLQLLPFLSWRLYCLLASNYSRVPLMHASCIYESIIYLLNWYIFDKLASCLVVIAAVCFTFSPPIFFFLVVLHVVNIQFLPYAPMQYTWTWSATKEFSPSTKQGRISFSPSRDKDNK